VRTGTFCVGDIVQVRNEFTSDDSSAEPAVLCADLRGEVRLLDGDGDAVIRFESADGKESVDRFVLSSRLRHLRVWRPLGEADSAEEDTAAESSDEEECREREAAASASRHGGDHAAFFRQLYRQPGFAMPWDIGRPQPDFEALHRAQPGLFRGPALDVGAGYGESSMWLSVELGLKVIACDVSGEAMEEAERRLQAARLEEAEGDRARKADLRFVECNILEETLPQALTTDAPFSMALDSAAFHCIGGEEEQRRYASNLASLVQPSGHLVLLAHSDRNGESNDPRMRRVTEAQLRDIFSVQFGWEVVQLSECLYCLLAPSMVGKPPHSFSLPAWLMVARRLDNNARLTP